jgi:hypothetical protein
MLVHPDHQSAPLRTPTHATLPMVWVDDPEQLTTQKNIFAKATIFLVDDSGC